MSLKISISDIKSSVSKQIENSIDTTAVLSFDKNIRLTSLYNFPKVWKGTVDLRGTGLTDLKGVGVLYLKDVGKLLLPDTLTNTIMGLYYIKEKVQKPEFNPKKPYSAELRAALDTIIHSNDDYEYTFSSLVAQGLAEFADPDCIFDSLFGE